MGIANVHPKLSNLSGMCRIILLWSDIYGQRPHISNAMARILDSVYQSKEQKPDPMLGTRHKQGRSLAGFVSRYTLSTVVSVIRR